MSETDTSATPEAAELLIELLADSNVAIQADEMTWRAIVREAGRHGVLPLLHSRIRKLPTDTIPVALAAEVRERYTLIALQSSLIFRELDVIASSLAAHDIPVLLLKGLHLAADVYDEPAMRTMGDIDIMVPRERLADASRALASAGFDAVPVADLDDFCRTNSHLPRMAPPGGRGIGVEVHWTIELPTSPFDIRPAELWAGARSHRINNRDVLLLSPEYLLLHLCLHACYHHRFDHTPLKQICDIAVVLRRYQQQIDWELLAGTAERWGIRTFVRFTLLLTREVLGSEVPDTIQSFPADADEARLLGNARAYVLNNTMSVPIALTRVVRAPTWTRRIRAMVISVFPPPARIAAIYGLPRNSARIILWYLIRPFDLLLRKGILTLELLLPGRTGRRMRYKEQNRALLKASLHEWSRAAGSSTNTL